MQPLVNGEPGPDESWEELAEHAFTHDDVPAGCEPYANGRGWWHVPGCPHVDWGGDIAFVSDKPAQGSGPDVE